MINAGKGKGKGTEKKFLESPRDSLVDHERNNREIFSQQIMWYVILQQYEHQLGGFIYCSYFYISTAGNSAYNCII